MNQKFINILEKWSQGYKRSIDCSHPKGFSQKAHCQGRKKRLQEDLRKWFNPKHPEGGWKRINSKGEAIGPCAREPGEPKPKCMSNKKRHQLSKKRRAAAVRAKRKYDSNPNRKGKPINVSNFGKGKLSDSYSHDLDNMIIEKNVPTSPEKWKSCIAQAKSKFDVYPSAYANGWAAKCYKKKGGGWKTLSESNMNESKKPFKGYVKGKNSPRGGLSRKYAHKMGIHAGVETEDEAKKKGGFGKLSPKTQKRRKSFCARMCGMKKRRTSKKTADDPKSKINAALRVWGCRCGANESFEQNINTLSENKKSMNKLSLKSIMERHLTSGEKKEKERIATGIEKKGGMKDIMKRYGVGPKRAKSIKIAIATKMAKKHSGMQTEAKNVLTEPAARKGKYKVGMRARVLKAMEKAARRGVQRGPVLGEEVVNKDHQPMTQAEIAAKNKCYKSGKMKPGPTLKNGDKPKNSVARKCTFAVLRSTRGGKGGALKSNWSTSKKGKKAKKEGKSSAKSRVKKATKKK
jgi:hypothetical protein